MFNSIGPQKQGEQPEINAPWASMQARPLSSSAPIDETDIRLMRAFKSEHTPYTVDASPDMEMIGCRTICRKCLLFTNVCYTLGHHVRECDNQIMKERFQSYLGSSP